MTKQTVYSLYWLSRQHKYCQEKPCCFKTSCFFSVFIHGILCLISFFSLSRNMIACITCSIYVLLLAYLFRSLMLSSHLTFIVSLDFILKEVALAIPEDKGKEWENECIQDADDGQDVGPAHWTVPQRVLPCLLTTQVLNHLSVPASRENDTPKHQTHSCREKKRGMLFWCWFRPGRKMHIWAENVKTETKQFSNSSAHKHNMEIL